MEALKKNKSEHKDKIKADRIEANIIKSEIARIEVLSRIPTPVGILRVLAKKRNIRLTLRGEENGKILFCTTAGAQKVKGRKRNLNYVLVNTLKKLEIKLKALKLRDLLVEYQGTAYRKKKNTILKKLYRIKFIIRHRLGFKDRKILKSEDFQMLNAVRRVEVKSLWRILYHSHNGCRPRKKRRK